MRKLTDIEAYEYRRQLCDPPDPSGVNPPNGAATRTEGQTSVTTNDDLPPPAKNTNKRNAHSMLSSAIQSGIPICSPPLVGLNPKPYAPPPCSSQTGPPNSHSPTQISAPMPLQPSNANVSCPQLHGMQNPSKTAQNSFTATGPTLGSGGTCARYNSKAIRILDDLIIPEYVKRTMSLGHSFNHPESGENEAKGLIMEELLAFSNLLVDHKGDMRVSHKVNLDEEVSNFIIMVKEKANAVYGGKSNQGRNAQIQNDYEETRKFLKNNPEIALSRADKGNITIASKLETIKHMMQKHIVEHVAKGTYIVPNIDIETIKGYMNNQWLKVYLMLGRHIINNAGGQGDSVHGKDISADLVLKHYGCASKKETDSFSPGRMFGQIKVHKEELSFRPIVDNSVRLGGPLEQYIMSKLNLILAKINVYNISNTRQLVGMIKGKFTDRCFIPKGHIVMSLDFESMYTNIPIKKALDIIEREWDACFPKPPLSTVATDNVNPHMGSSEARKVIEFFTEKGGFFLANGCMYKQNKGLMMGASLSAAVSAILINDTILRMKPDISDKTLIVVYADDILMIGDPRDIGVVTHSFKVFLPEMKFAIEEETEKAKSTYSIQYLEVQIERLESYSNGVLVGSNITTLWKKRAYDSGSTMDFDSFHEWPTKRALISEMLAKAIHLSSLSKMEAAIEQWFDVLEQNFYPDWLLVRTAYSFLPNIGLSASAFKSVKNSLNNACKKKKISKQIPRDAFTAQTSKKDRKEKGNEAFVAFPMSENISGGKAAIKRLFPNLTVTPATSHKNRDTLLTKVKDPLDLIYAYNKVFKWECPNNGCRMEFLAIARANSVSVTLGKISEHKEGAYGVHWSSNHSGPTITPTSIKVLSKKNETGISTLDNRLHMELIASPHLILATANPTYTIRKDITNAISSICNLNAP